MRVLPSMDFGGIERGVYDFSIKASELGHEIIIVSGYGRFIPQLIKNKNIRWYNLPLEKKNILNFFKGRKKLLKIIKKEIPDIIHVQSRFPSWIICSLKSKLENIPVVTSIHSIYPFYLYSQSTGKGDLVIVVSKFLEEYAIKKLKVNINKIRLVYNGISDEFSRIEKTKKEKIVIGMIGRFTKSKGWFYFLEAVKDLYYENKYDFETILIGSGSKSYEKKIKKWIEKNNLSKKIKILKCNSIDGLKLIDLLVIPSIKAEGFGRTVVEGQFAKVPVIASNIGAIPELIEDSKTGFLVSPKDSISIAEKIKYLMNNPEVIEKITDNAYKFVKENFSVDKMVEKTLNVYKELL
ncbi:MAG TPA: glycosyltransferase family 4 protein [bacterium]|nr:glycosyltransferase family 4 protein [bacterium]